MSNLPYELGTSLAWLNDWWKFHPYKEIWSKDKIAPAERLREFRRNHPEEKWLEIFGNDPPNIQRGQTAVEKLVTILSGERPGFSTSDDDPNVTISPHDNAMRRFRSDYIDSIASKRVENLERYVSLVDDGEFLRGFADQLIDLYNRDGGNV